MVVPRLVVPSVLAAALVLIFVVAAPGAIGPENVLVLYNQASTEGTQVASYYSQVHPGVQLLGLTDVGLGEVISADEYLNNIRPQILSALTPSIDVLVTTKGLPLRIVNSHESPDTYTDPFGVVRRVYASTWKPYSSLESELAQIDIVSTWEQMGDQTWWIPEGYPGYPHHSRNPYYKVEGEFHHTDYEYEIEDGVLYGPRVLSCRLDGFTVADITASIDRAQQAFIGPFHFVVDDDLGQSLLIFDRMEALANDVLDPAGVPYTYDPADPDDPTTDTFVTDAPGPVVGYVSYGVHGGGKPAPDGYLVDEVDGLTFDLANGAVFHTWESYNAYSFVEGGNRSGQGLVAEWIARGGTAGTGHVEEPDANPTNVTNEDLMFEMLLDGYTWAEAAWSATGQLSFVNTVVGDPLMVFRELIPGDASMDGLVGSADLARLGANWGLAGESGGAMWGQGDFSRDGLVGSADLAVLGANWGASADWYAGSTAVGELDIEAFLDSLGNRAPEPSNLVSALIGLLVLLGCGWRWCRPAVA